MVLGKWTVATVVLAVTLTGLMVGLAAYQIGTADDKPGGVPEPKPREYYDAPSQREGLLVLVGTELKDDEKCEADREVKVKVGDTARRFRKLKVGDKVEAGQQLGLIDPSLALGDVAIRQSRLTAAKAEYEAAEKTRESNAERLTYLLKLNARGGGLITENEVRTAKLGGDTSSLEMVVKREGVKTAELELNQAVTVLRSHEVRTGVNGVITHIFYRPGEAVRKFDPVVRIRLADEDR